MTPAIPPVIPTVPLSDMTKIVNKTDVKSLNDPDAFVFFYNVNRDAFTLEYDAETTTHIVKVPNTYTAQETDAVFDDVFIDYLIEHGRVG
jgi:hypothetical protein